MRKLIVVCLSLAIVALTGFIVAQRGQSATADDAQHVTTLSIGSHTFDAGGPEPAVLATLMSTDSLDMTWRICLFSTPPGGGPEAFRSIAEADRADGEQFGCNAALNLASLPSGTTVRAAFETLGAGGTPRFTFSRTISVP